ncbi:MAG: hypothetical protein K6F04_04355, partial [bacterium]|nr:hypothetical protein [bacterium]
SDIKNRTKKNVVEIQKNMEIIDICMSALKECKGKDENCQKQIKNQMNLDIEKFSEEFSMSEEQMNFETEKRIKSLQFLKNKENLPFANVGVSNAFSLNLDKETKTKYPFLLGQPKIKSSNYMDFKFYVCIPIPDGNVGKSMKKDYMICEIIATLDCFEKVYEKTHSLFELERKEFKKSKNDDLSEDKYKLALNILRRAIYIDDVIEKYNKEHPNSIQILPHNDNKEFRDDVLDKIGSSLTLTSALCGCRDLMR